MQRWTAPTPDEWSFSHLMHVMFLCRFKNAVGMNKFGRIHLSSTQRPTVRSLPSSLIGTQQVWRLLNVGWRTQNRSLNLSLRTWFSRRCMCMVLDKMTSNSSRWAPTPFARLLSRCLQLAAFICLSADSSTIYPSSASFHILRAVFVWEYISAWYFGEIQRFQGASLPDFGDFVPT